MSAAPLGLTLLFATVRPNGYTPLTSSVDAARVLPLAARILETAHTTGADAGRAEVFARAVDAMYPTLRAENEVEELTAVDAGFSIGFATCWLVLQHVAGRIAVPAIPAGGDE